MTDDDSHRNTSFSTHYYTTFHIPLTLYPRKCHLRHSSLISIFYQNDLAIRNTIDVSGGKPKFRLHKTGNTFFGKCIQIYNKVPLNVTKLPLHKLKQTVKVTLMKQGYYKVEDYLEDKNIWK
jgi:hypothetical protein